MPSPMLVARSLSGSSPPVGVALALGAVDVGSSVDTLATFSVLTATGEVVGSCVVEATAAIVEEAVGSGSANSVGASSGLWRPEGLRGRRSVPLFGFGTRPTESQSML